MVAVSSFCFSSERAVCSAGLGGCESMTHVAGGFSNEVFPVPLIIDGCIPNVFLKAVEKEFDKITKLRESHQRSEESLLKEIEKVTTKKQKYMEMFQNEVINIQELKWLYMMALI